MFARILRDSMSLTQRIFRTARRTNELLTDRWLNIHTCATSDQVPDAETTFGDPVEYDPLHYFLIWRCIRKLQPTPNDVVFDIGCGSARILCAFARQKLRHCIGIEYDPTLSKLARRNVIRLRGVKTPIEIRNVDAASADYSQGTIYCMYNPFGRDTMREVLARIRASLDVRPRRVQLVYFSPWHEDLLADADWLRCADRVSTRFSRIDTSYWVSVQQTLVKRCPHDLRHSSVPKFV